jgi:hypothetical protein
VDFSNGPFDSLNQTGFPANGDFGDSVLKLTAIGGSLIASAGSGLNTPLDLDFLDFRHPPF